MRQQTSARTFPDLARLLGVSESITNNVDSLVFFLESKQMIERKMESELRRWLDPTYYAVVLNDVKYKKTSERIELIKQRRKLHIARVRFMYPKLLRPNQELIRPYLKALFTMYSKALYELQLKEIEETL